MTINASKLYRKFRGGVEFGISVFDQVPTGSKIWQKVHYKLKIRCSLSVLHADHKKAIADDRVRTCAGRAQWISSPSP